MTAVPENRRLDESTALEKKDGNTPKTRESVLGISSEQLSSLKQGVEAVKTGIRDLLNTIFESGGPDVLTQAVGILRTFLGPNSGAANVLERLTNLPFVRQAQLTGMLQKRGITLEPGTNDNTDIAEILALAQKSVPATPAPAPAASANAPAATPAPAPADGVSTFLQRMVENVTGQTTVTLADLKKIAVSLAPLAATTAPSTPPSTPSTTPSPAPNAAPSTPSTAPGEGLPNDFGSSLPEDQRPTEAQRKAFAELADALKNTPSNIEAKLAALNETNVPADGRAALALAFNTIFRTGRSSRELRIDSKKNFVLVS